MTPAAWWGIYGTGAAFFARDPPRSSSDVCSPDGKVAVHVFIYMRAFGGPWIDDVTLTLVPSVEEKAAGAKRSGT